MAKALIPTQLTLIPDSWCEYYADVGYVGTLQYQNDDIEIRHVSRVSREIQDALNVLLSKWSLDLEDSRLTLEDMRKWSTVFVLLRHDETPLGCVSIDRSNFLPFVGNLYVHPEFRRRGYGELLLSFAEKHIGILKFTSARLWCHDEMVAYYEKRGYAIESQVDKNVMVKSLVDDEDGVFQEDLDGDCLQQLTKLAETHEMDSIGTTLG